jgi:hypothetical protein
MADREEVVGDLVSRDRDLSSAGEFQVTTPDQE